MLIILSTSSSNSFILEMATISELIIILIQYLVSLASFKAMEYLDIKSAFDCANIASATFAPILVPLLRNCLASTFPASSKCLLFSSQYALITLIANFSVRSWIVILLFINTIKCGNSIVSSKRYSLPLTSYLLPFTCSELKT